ncbi:inhibitor of complement-mediated lysis [Streptococcus dysgalactiae subsp. equisimilis]|uniref:hypothetical protein n=1 Tax=Streptococcus dysgalactiae TaxID=1334 RepID=UPI000DA355F9|nr:hypothetical protein [Streptococcus dysgalactiae]SQF77734.1 inhibitor of complement-mediated lysis [Streptococcus dysgalactiae subsp. equisimilis]
MKIKKNIKLSKRLLFTSLAAVALLGATQPVLAETYLSEDSASPKVNQRELEWPELPPAPKLPSVPQLPESLDDLWSWGEDRTQPPYPGLLAQQPSAPELPQAPQWPELPPAPKLPSVPQLPESLDDLWSWGEDRTQPPYPGLLAQQPSAPELPQAPQWPELPPAPKLPSVPQLPESLDDLWSWGEDRTQPPYPGLLAQQPSAPELPQAPQWPELPPAPKLPPVPQLPESLDDLWSWGEDRTQPPYPGLLAQQPSAPENPKDDYQQGFEDGRKARSERYGLDYSRLHESSTYSEQYKRGYMEGYLKG